MLTCYTAKVALATVWPPVFIPAGQRGQYDWLGEEVCAAGPTMHTLLENMVLEGGGVVPLPEYVTVTRPDGSTISLGPSLTQPHREMKRVEVVTTARGPVAKEKVEDEEEDSGFEEESDEEEQEFEEMLKKRREELSDEEREQEDEDAKEELQEAKEDVEEEKEKDKENNENDVDVEERRRMKKQRRRSQGE